MCSDLLTLPTPRQPTVCRLTVFLLVSLQQILFPRPIVFLVLHLTVLHPLQ
jgi:hypothetical protein